MPPTQLCVLGSMKQVLMGLSVPLFVVSYLSRSPHRLYTWASATPTFHPSRRFNCSSTLKMVVLSLVKLPSSKLRVGSICFLFGHLLSLQNGRSSVSWGAAMLLAGWVIADAYTPHPSIAHDPSHSFSELLDSQCPVLLGFNEAVIGYAWPSGRMCLVIIVLKCAWSLASMKIEFIWST